MVFSEVTYNFWYCTSICTWTCHCVRNIGYTAPSFVRSVFDTEWPRSLRCLNCGNQKIEFSVKNRRRTSKRLERASCSGRQRLPTAGHPPWHRLVTAHSTRMQRDQCLRVLPALRGPVFARARRPVSCARRARRKPPCGRVRAASVLKFAGAPSCCITLRIPSRAPSLVCWQNCVRACLCVCVAFLPPFLGKNGKKEIATKKTKKPMKWVSFDFNVPYSSFWGYSLINTLKLERVLIKWVYSHQRG